MTHTYKEIVTKAKECKTSVEKTYKLGVSTKWSYYFAKAILTKRNVTKITFNTASKPSGDYLSTQILEKDYIDIANRLVKYVEKHKTLPNYVTYKSKKIRVRDYTYLLARILKYYDSNKKLPSYANINTKCWTKPTETKNTVYNYFVKVFGNFDNTIDGALKKIAGKGYGYYYDDTYSNVQSIDRMKQGKGVNCTDSCQVFYNIMLQLIELGKYKKVECLHVKCQGGDGHVRLRITLNDGSKIYRDPAAVLDSGNVTHNWCLNGTLLAVNPAWFMNNLNR